MTADTAVHDELGCLASKKPTERSAGATRLLAKLEDDPEAAQALLPSLVELACDRSTPDRHRVVALIAAIAGGGAKAFSNDGSLPQLEVASKKNGPRGVREIASSQEKAWLVMLGDRDPRVRAAAAWLLALVARQPSKAADAIAEALATEKDDPARAAELVAIGVLDWREHDTKHKAVLLEATGEFLEDKKRAPSPLVSTAAVLGLSYAWPFGIRASMLARLRKNLKVSAPAESLPIHGGALGALAKLRLSAIEKVDVEAWTAEIDRLLARHKPKPVKGSRDVKHDPEVTAPWITLVDRLFAPFEGRGGDPVVPQELSEEQKAVLVFGCKRNLNTWFERLGIGHVDTQDDAKGSRGMYWSMRRFLGVAPAGPLDRIATIDKHSAPWWKFFSMLARKKVAPASIEKALNALPDRELLDLATDVTEGAYSSSWREGVLDRSLRAEVLLKTLDTHGLTEAQYEPVRVVLQAMATARVGLLREQGWTTGPFAGKGKRA